ncbi:craniofacial development protein 1-like [Patiria miniata]|uniref:Craniofacial development protein 1 n=1 Tax=Patiria miniata TaxID=46514 RepID=A0A914B2M9_PATMI|nr:craniofacial development protein 1-like [Patiria miniata]
MICEPEDDDYSSDEDEDYLPSGEASEGESEDDDVEEEEGCEGGEVKVQQKSKVKKGRSKRKRRQTPEIKRSRTGGIQLPEKEGTEGPAHEKDAEEAVGTLFKEEELRAAEMRKEEKQKQKADDLWSSFMKDVGQKPKAKMQSSGRDSSSSSGAASKQMTSGTNGRETKPEKNETTSSAVKKTVTVTKVFDFAGEEVKVTTEVSADSKEAKELLQPSPPTKDAAAVAGVAPQSTSSTGSKRPGGGLSSVLGLINKKPKISVLEKSRLDWNNFTTKQGITDELKLHNKGKEGYIEKQKFLAQADQRQYEKERDVRMGLDKR